MCLFTIYDGWGDSEQKMGDESRYLSSFWTKFSSATDNQKGPRKVGSGETDPDCHPPCSVNRADSEPGNEAWT